MKKVLAVFTFVLIFSVFGFAQNENVSCPRVVIVSPDEPVNPGEPISFSVMIGNETGKSNLEYTWIVDAGTITEGQGTSTITVSTLGLESTVITVKVELKGLPANCTKNASETAVVAPRISCGFQPWEYAKVPLEEELSIFDSISIELKDSPDFQGFVLMTIKVSESSEDVKRHIRRLIEHIEMRKFSKDRFIFGIKKSNHHMTQIYLIPQNAELPGCEDCEIIRGEDVILK